MERNIAPTKRSQGFEWAAAIMAIIMLSGSLYMSMGLGLKACPLCLYERSLVMGVVGVLGLGLTLRLDRLGLLSMVCLPLAFAGAGLAAFHVYLDRFGILDCPPGILGIGHAPDQSLVGFLLLITLLIGASCRPIDGTVRHYLRMTGALVMGLVFAFLSVKSAPPLPPPNPKYDSQGNRILSGCEPAPSHDRNSPIGVSG